MSQTFMPMNQRGVMDSAITALILKFHDTYNRIPELDELPDFVDVIGANLGCVESIINAKFPTAGAAINDYPDFWEKLAFNIQLEAIPRSVRPDRMY